MPRGKYVPYFTYTPTYLAAALVPTYMIKEYESHRSAWNVVLKAAGPSHLHQVRLLITSRDSNTWSIRIHISVYLKEAQMGNARLQEHENEPGCHDNGVAINQAR